jgi:hypothetical protein
MKKLLVVSLTLGSFSVLAQSLPNELGIRINRMERICDSHITGSSSISEALSKTSKAYECLKDQLEILKTDAPRYGQELESILVEGINTMTSSCQSHITPSSSFSSALSKTSKAYECLKEELGYLKKDIGL